MRPLDIAFYKKKKDFFNFKPRNFQKLSGGKTTKFWLCFGSETQNHLSFYKVSNFNPNVSFFE